MTLTIENIIFKLKLFNLLLFKFSKIFNLKIY